MCDYVQQKDKNDSHVFACERASERETSKGLREVGKWGGMGSRGRRGGGHSSFYLLHLGSGKSPSHQTSKQENTHSRRVALASSVLRGVEYSRPRPHWGWSHSPCVYGAWESAALAPPPREGLIYNGSSSVFQQTLLDPHKPDTILSPGEVKTVLLGMWSPPRGSSAGLAMWTYPQIPVLASGP